MGNRLQVELNGQEVLDWEAEPRGKVEDFAPRGYIGLQNHDDGSLVHFRNIYVKALDWERFSSRTSARRSSSRRIRLTTGSATA